MGTDKSLPRGQITRKEVNLPEIAVPKDLRLSWTSEAGETVDFDLSAIITATREEVFAAAKSGEYNPHNNESLRRGMLAFVFAVLEKNEEFQTFCRATKQSTESAFEQVAKLLLNGNTADTTKSAMTPAVKHTISESMHRYYAEIDKEAGRMIDPKTGLPLAEACDKYVELLIENNIPFTMFSIDLKGLKAQNTVFGEIPTDFILYQVCQRFARVTRPGTTYFGRKVAGGDEIWGVAAGTEKIADVNSIFSRILSEVINDYVKMPSTWGELRKMKAAEKKGLDTAKGSSNPVHSKDPAIQVFRLLQDIFYRTFGKDLEKVLEENKNEPDNQTITRALEIKVSLRGSALLVKPQTDLADEKLSASQIREIAEKDRDLAKDYEAEYRTPFLVKELEYPENYSLIAENQRLTSIQTPTAITAAK